MTTGPIDFMFSDPSNEGFSDVVRELSRVDHPKLVIVSGEAGTGKSTFVQEFKAWCKEKGYSVQCVAFTGRAAANIEGRTIHSFFFRSIGPRIPTESIFDHFKKEVGRQPMSNPDSKASGSSKRPILFQAEKAYSCFENVFTNREAICNLDFLIIDEYSMLRCDVIDMIDIAMRWALCKDLPFGGKRVILFGDVAQLPPVVSELERSVLSHYYSEPFNMKCSDVYKEIDHAEIQLESVYRQKEPGFIKILRSIRLRGLMPDTVEELNQRLKTSIDFETSNFKKQIICSTNYKCQQYNLRYLQLIEGELYEYEAEIKDNFPEGDHPTDAILRLRIGAKVMIVRNDSAQGYFNGMVGYVRGLSPDSVEVEVEGKSFSIVQHEWIRQEYEYDETTRRTSSKYLGTFRQLPLKLAWAITTHKTQGMTFDNVMCDLSDEFLPENTYVALSRCRSLEGLELLTKLEAGPWKA